VGFVVDEEEVTCEMPDQQVLFSSGLHCKLNAISQVN
jgi:hypothetical protein